MKLLKPMLPTLVTEIPKGPNWLYEVKYDGFRAMIYINETESKIISRNLKLLNEQFPEINLLFRRLSTHLKLPIILDGELCVLETDMKANFDKIQKRGRLRNKDKIEQAEDLYPVTFLAFDLLMENGMSLTEKTLTDRKKHLIKLFKEVEHTHLFKIVQPYEDEIKLWDSIKREHGEGIIAKQKESSWIEGQRSKQWLKIKNMSIATFFIIGYDETNAFFHIGCIHNRIVKMIGKVGQGFSKEEKEALIDIVKKNSHKKHQHILYVQPGICIEVEFLEMSKNELRHPKFRRFRFDKHWEDCLWEAIPMG
ncbi:non-homologous end-joining DNA ligase [Anaerobacillus alkalidiazotrophicus]|uniref:non-homologous end-joining DNA ligase n=1 Tax=Anaerobacillus alkalidiazotrophicus TaxID=472963 RepID=UPI000A06C9FE|nr:non-homologous end-joining DNA ligase [Anaerobacillus alkalidiazotrophicus]